MGQYWKCVNLDKREFINSYKLGSGLKLWEQLANHPGTGAALITLCAAMPESRGGGDLSLYSDDENYDAIAARTIGRWAGDRIALVGDYAERSDLPLEDDADLIYHLCCSENEIRSCAAYWEKCEWTDDPETKAHYADKAHRLRAAEPYTDITDDVCAVIEYELQGRFVGSGWREFEYG